MNAIQFGRWLGERRHKCGWTSQRALAVAAQHHPYTAGLHVSEAFLARLEAGLLAHPFRGTVRERVLALAWLVCKTPRQMRAYLAAAGLTDLTSDEQHCMTSLDVALRAPHAPPPVRLPRRTPRLIAREREMSELLELLTQLDTGWVAVTGLPGIGKSALVAETLHLLSTAPAERRAFPDGIVTFDCGGRVGPSGLQSLLDDVAMVYERGDQPRAEWTARHRDADRERVAGAPHDLARATDRARSALHGLRTLVLLDGVDARFPLTSAFEALLAADSGMSGESRLHAPCRGRVVLVTSRYLPRSSQLGGHLALRPLDQSASIELLERIAGRCFAGRERDVAARLCEAAGGIPLAIEEIGTTLAVAQLSLYPRTDPLLAVRLLDRQSGGDGMCERLRAAIGLLDDDARGELRRLAAPGAPDEAPCRRWHTPRRGQPAGAASVRDVSARARGEGGDDEMCSGPGEWAVAAIAQLVRHSLIEPLGTAGVVTGAIESRFRLNPLVRALILSGAAGEPTMSSATIPDGSLDDAVLYLRRGGTGGTALGGLKAAAQQRAGGQ